MTATSFQVALGSVQQRLQPAQGDPSAEHLLRAYHAPLATHERQQALAAATERMAELTAELDTVQQIVMGHRAALLAEQGRL